MVSTKLRIKNLLRERRWTTKVLAQKTGMSESYLTHIKNGTRRWNEDALKKLADAFCLEPADLFQVGKNAHLGLRQTIAMSKDDGGEVEVKVVPVLGSLPSHPSPYNNRLIQMQTGFQSAFLPVLEAEDPALFAYCVNDESLTPLFVKGDYLIISPETFTRSGDIAAVEYGDSENRVRAIKKISYNDGIIVLDCPSHKALPVALTRGKDHFRVIGKLMYRYANI